MSTDRSTTEPLEATSASKSTFLKPGTELLQGRFRVVELLGRGGMGEVYLAEQTSLGRKVALKTLRDDLSLQPGMTERFKREALLLSSVDHPSVVRVIDFGEAQGTYVLVMEYVEGENLSVAVRAGPMEPVRAIRVLRDIAEGLAEIHARGIVHRDLKLDNVLLAGGPGGERARLLDFGIARLAEAEGGGSGQAMTQAGLVLGTPEYLSPEQATGGKIDARTDVYAFGILAYRMLAGRHPFPGPTARDFMLQHISVEPPPLSVPGFPRLEKLVMSCLQKRAPDRPDGGKGLLAALQAIDTSSVPTAPSLTGREERAGQTLAQRTPRAAAAGIIGRNVALVCVSFKDFSARSNAELLQAREQSVLGVIRAGEGRVVSVLHDQVLCTFELPSHAVACGMAIQDALWRRNASAAVKLEAAVTVHQGEVVVSGESLLGEPAQLLAELAKQTPPCEVRLSRAVWLSMAKNGVQADEAGEVSVAVNPEPVRVLRCRASAQGAPFGGKDLTLAQPGSLIRRLLG